jgi:hypothetical protein
LHFDHFVSNFDLPICFCVTVAARRLLHHEPSDRWRMVHAVSFSRCRCYAAKSICRRIFALRSYGRRMCVPLERRIAPQILRADWLQSQQSVRAYGTPFHYLIANF